MKIKLSKICHVCSGDKSDALDIGLIVYRKEEYDDIKEKVIAEKVKEYFQDIYLGPVERFEMPNINALNFILHNTPGGGGTVSLKNHSQDKTHASGLLMIEIETDN